MLRVTLDTNTANRLAEIEPAVAGRDVELAVTTVTQRESRGVNWPDLAVPETMVWDESPWGEAVWGGAVVMESLIIGESHVGAAVVGANDNRFEVILRIVGGGGFPPIGARDELSSGQRNQLRDAMILEAHLRDGRDILVSQDETGFGSRSAPDKPHREQRRRELEETLGTRIMTVDEFLDYLATL